jgi:hypothetical protein
MPDRQGARPLGWVSFALRLARGQLGLLAASMLTALVAATLLITASVLAPAVAEQSFRETVDAVPAADNDLRASTAFNPDNWSDVDNTVREVTAGHGALVGEVTSAAWTVGTRSGADEEDGRLVVGAVRDADHHAELAEGRWPEPAAEPIETAVHVDALAALGLQMGDRLSIDLFAAATDTVDAVVVGTFEPADREHLLWRGLGHGVDVPDDGTATTGPALFAPADLVERLRPRATTAAWTVGVDLSDVAFGAAPSAIRSLAELRAGLADVSTEDSATQMSVGGGTDVLAQAHDAAASARAVLLVIVTMVTVLAAWALAFTARILAAERAPATALFRARGGRDRLVARVSALSAAVPAVVLAVAAPPAAEAVLRELRDRDLIAGTADPAAWWLISVAAAACWLALVVLADLRAGRSTRDVAAESARPSRRAAAQRAGLDVVVLAVGVLALQQLRRPSGETPDVVLIAAPTILVLAGTLIAMRLLPWCGRAVSRAAARWRGVSAVLGSFEVARRPIRHLAPVAMLTLALAAAVFAATTQATWTAFRDNSAALSEPADVRLSMASVVTAGTAAQISDLGDQLAAIDHVETAMPVHRETARSDRSDVELVGVDPALAADVMRWPRVLAGAPVSGLLDALATADGVSALVTQPYVDHLGLEVGSRTQVRIRGRSISVAVAGVVQAVPGSAEPFAMLVDEQHLRYALRENVPSDDAEVAYVEPLPNEWWLSTSGDGAAAAVAAAAAELSDQVASTSTHAAASGSDAMSRGIVAGLLGGLAFAAAFGVVGAVLHAVASYRARAGEHAVLRAVGLPRSSTLGSVAIEQALLIGFATATGLALGALVSWLTVSHTVGRLAGLAEMPPLALEVPWPFLAVAGAAAVTLLGLIVVTASAALRRVQITSVLRAGEEA